MNELEAIIQSLIQLSLQDDDPKAVHSLLERRQALVDELAHALGKLSAPERQSYRPLVDEVVAHGHELQRRAESRLAALRERASRMVEARKAVRGYRSTSPHQPGSVLRSA